MKRARGIALTAAIMLTTAVDGMAASSSSSDGGRDLQTLIREEGLRESSRPLPEIVQGWRPRKVVALIDDYPGRAETLQAAAPEVRLVAVRTNQEALAEAADADGLINTCDASVVAAARKIRWLQVLSTGVETCAPLVRGRRNLVLTNMQRVNSETLSDHALALTLALTRGLDIFATQTREGRLDRSKVPSTRMRQLRGHTILIVGLGGVGTDVARKAHAFGMRVLATRNSTRDGPDFVERVGLSHELPQLIGQADVVVMTAPLTKETTNLFNKEMFDRMKTGAVFVNVARGGSVVQADLIAALEAGQVGAAGLDVTNPEPLAIDDPLFSAPNVLLTPHIAGDASTSADRREEAWRLTAENLRRYVAGGKLYNLVDVERGY